MKLKRFLYLFVAAITALSFGLGCLGGGESLSKSTGISKTGSLRPRITAVSVVNNGYPAMGSSTATVPDGTDTHYITISFSAEMDPATITTANIYLTDVTAGAPAATPLAGQTVTWDKNNRAAVLVWTSAVATSMELYVSSNVGDLTKERISGLCSLGGFPDVYPFNQNPTEYRRMVETAVSGWAPDYFPESVYIFDAAADADSADILLVASSGDIDEATIAEANFTITPAVTAPTHTGTVNGGDYVMPYTGLTENTEYTATLTGTANIKIDHTVAARTYPDTTTPIPIIGGVDIIETYHNGIFTLRESDYTHKFITQNTTLVPPTVVATSAEGNNQGLPAGMNNVIIQIEYDIEMNAESIADPDNYIVDDMGGDIVKVDITPYYETGDTFLHRVLVSTLNYSQATINSVTIKTDRPGTNNGVRDLLNVPLDDGGADGFLAGGNDYNLDGDPDDWYNY